MDSVSIEKGYPEDPGSLAEHPRVDWPSFQSELNMFVYDQCHPNSPLDSDSDSDVDPPDVHGQISVYHSATAIFYAPSDLCGVGGMRKEVIRATPTWRHGPPRYDCVFVVTHPREEGFRALHVARVKLFFSFKNSWGNEYPCALVHWFEVVGEHPHDDTGMWVVEPEFVGPADNAGHRKPKLAIISIDTILRAAHLIPVYGDSFLPQDSSFSETLDKYQQFFVNKYVDHHAYEVAF